jgi:hypothetical protein
MHEANGPQTRNNTDNLFTDPGMEPMFTALHQVISQSLDALQLDKPLPALILLYSAIDAVSGLESSDGRASKAAFVHWVDHYMLPLSLSRVTALEVYAARCAILHSFGHDSDLSRSGKARIFTYAWHSANPQDIQDAIDASARAGTSVAVSVNDLIDAFAKALAYHLGDAVNDADRHRLLVTRIRRWLAPISVE